jgi:hypothetical protein
LTVKATSGDEEEEDEDEEEATTSSKRSSVAIDLIDKERSISRRGLSAGEGFGYLANSFPVY